MFYFGPSVISIDINLLMSVLKIFLVLILWTAIGQIPIKDRSLEYRYHEIVTSDRFQDIYWKLATPLTWTAEKVQKLWEEHRAKNLPAR